MADGGASISETAPVRAGELSIQELLEVLVVRSSNLRAAALIGADGSQIAATDGADWAPGVAVLWGAADAGESGPGTQIHVGTGQGEVFALRGRSHSLVVTSERFTLASLAFCDLRSILRVLEQGSAA